MCIMYLREELVVLRPLYLEVRRDHLHVLLPMLQRIPETAQRQPQEPNERQAVGIQVRFLSPHFANAVA